MDLNYILGGGPRLTRDELELLDNYRACSGGNKDRVKRLALRWRNEKNNK